MRKRFRKCFDKRALTPVISSMIMASVVIALSFAVLDWSQFRTSDYAETYGETTDAEIAKLKERLTVEYIFYNGTYNNIRVYILNSGTIDNVNITRVLIQNDLGYMKDFSITELTLDMRAEGNLIIPSDEALEGNYFVRIFTERGSIFDSGFVA